MIERNPSKTAARKHGQADLQALGRLRSRIRKLRIRCQESEDTLRALRAGEVDALVMHGPRGDQVYTLKGADHTYRIFTEAMSEGAVILGEDGIILYCNRSFAQMLKIPLEEVMGLPFERLIPPQGRSGFQALLRGGRRESSKQEITLQAKSGAFVPAQLSINTLKTEEWTGLCMIVTDLTAQKRTEDRLQRLSHRLLEVKFSHSGIKDRRFQTETETSAYRIIQESLTNVARHARASEIAVQIRADERTLHLSVRDNGLGFDVRGALESRASSGLSGMRERASLLGGELTFHSAPEFGTEVQAKLPLAPSS